ncbi:MAG: Hsp20/alpha crystallin family protein [Balneolaceae bacterium]|nr:Hsp20/alpha crystallin family protein [Balneolaceae bacterium]
MLTRKRNFPMTLSERTPTRFSEWLDEFFEDAYNLNSGSFLPELNVYEEESAFEITCELPGMKKENINISYDDNRLTISGERRAKHEEEDGRRYRRVESRFGKFTRTLPLPANINAEKIDANYENGVLTVHVPKTKQETGKKIEVK